MRVLVVKNTSSSCEHIEGDAIAWLQTVVPDCQSGHMSPTNYLAVPCVVLRTEKTVRVVPLVEPYCQIRVEILPEDFSVVT